MSGMSETTILNYELGYMPIAYDKAKRLAKALEIDERLLFDEYCRFLDYPFQLRCKELRSELGMTQFEIADNRSLQEIYDAIKDQGLQPVLNEYIYV